MRFVAPQRQGFAPLELVPAVAVITFGCVLSVTYLANVHLIFAAGRSLWSPRAVCWSVSPAPT